MRIVVAPDSFGGSLTASQAATAIAHGWRRAREDDDVVTCPLSDGGEGLMAVLARQDDRFVEVEVADALGRPVLTRWLQRADGVAVVEAAAACGLALVPDAARSPMTATSFGVGQLLSSVLDAGATRVVVGLGGTATTDAGLGALTGLGFRLRTADGSGLKVGGADVGELTAIEPGWAPDLAPVEVELWADVDAVLAEAPRMFGPQKGATPQDIAALERNLRTVVEVIERDLSPPRDDAGRQLHEQAGSGAAGGLGYGLAAALGASLVPGAAAAARAQNLDAVLAGADVVLTGEGRLDATSGRGKVIGHVARQAALAGVPVVAIVGQDGRDGRDGNDGWGRGAGALPFELAEVVASSPEGPSVDAASRLEAAAEKLARRWR